MWSPVQLERLTLATSVAPDECVERLSRTTSPGIAWLRPSRHPVRGFVKKRRFYFGRGAATRMPLRTWIAGRVREEDGATVIDVAIGPNPVGGLVLTVIAALLLASAILVTAVAMEIHVWS